MSRPVGSNYLVKGWMVKAWDETVQRWDTVS